MLVMMLVNSDRGSCMYKELISDFRIVIIIIVCKRGRKMCKRLTVASDEVNNINPVNKTSVSDWFMVDTIMLFVIIFIGRQLMHMHSALYDKL